MGHLKAALDATDTEYIHPLLPANSFSQILLAYSVRLRDGDAWSLSPDFQSRNDNLASKRGITNKLQVFF